MSSSFEKSVKGATKIKVSQSVSQGIGNRKQERGGRKKEKERKRREKKKKPPRTQEAQETRERVMRDMQQILI